MTNLELLKQALDNIIEVNNFYKDSYDIKISTTNLEFIINKLSFCEKFDIPLRSVVSSYGNSLKLYGWGSTDFNIIHNPYLTNKQTHYKFDENKNYIQLDNGNIGRLMFGTIDSVDYPSTDSVWKEFKDTLLSYNPLDWDDMNFNYVYSEEDGVRLYKDFAEIYRIYKNKFDEVLKASKIQRLEKQLSKLKGEQSSENT